MFFNYDDFTFQAPLISRFYHQDGSFRVAPRPYATISFRVKGQVIFNIENTSFTVSTGDITFFPANVGYEVVYDNSEIILINLTNCNYSRPENITPNHPEFFSRIFSQLLEEWNEKHMINMLKSSIYKLFALIEEDVEKSFRDSFQSCNLYIQKHYLDQDLKIHDICRYGNISESSLYRSFMSYYKLSPKQYLLKLRLNHAIELLSLGEMSIEEVAVSSGFSDPKYFSRAFKKHYGSPPSRFINAN